jgi:hypothetical protein
VYRKAAGLLTTEFGMTERRACRVLGFPLLRRLLLMTFSAHLIGTHGALTVDRHGRHRRPQRIEQWRQPLMEPGALDRERDVAGGAVEQLDAEELLEAVMARLTVDAGTSSLPAAAEKLRSRATPTKVRRWFRSIVALPQWNLANIPVAQHSAAV